MAVAVSVSCCDTVSETDSLIVSVLLGVALKVLVVVPFVAETVNDGNGDPDELTSLVSDSLGDCDDESEGVDDKEDVADSLCVLDRDREFVCDSLGELDREIREVSDSVSESVLLLVTDSERERERSSESDRVPVAVAVALSGTVSDAESEAEGVAVPRVTETLKLRDAVASTVSDAETVRESNAVTLPEIERLSELVGVPREIDTVGELDGVTEVEAEPLSDSDCDRENTPVDESEIEDETVIEGLAVCDNDGDGLGVIVFRVPVIDCEALPLKTFVSVVLEDPDTTTVRLSVSDPEDDLEKLLAMESVKLTLPVRVCVTSRVDVMVIDVVLVAETSLLRVPDAEIESDPVNSTLCE